MCLLGSVYPTCSFLSLLIRVAGWAKWMQWRYPVEVVYTDKAAFRATGAVEAAASL